MELTILMPCLNEAETLVECIEKAKAFLEKEKIHGEVLIADNGSTDGSQNLAEKHGARIAHATRRGYGAALITGIQTAKGQYVIMGDADASYDFSNLMPFVEKLRSGYELVMGNRFKGGIKSGAMPFLNKYLGNPVLSFIGSLFFKCPIKDFHCGLRGFNRIAIERLNLQAPGMEFASEMVIKSALQKLKISEVPTTLSPDGRSRPPHLRKWRDGWRHLKLLLLLSPRWLFLYPGFFFCGLGLALMLVLCIAPIKMGPYSLDIHTLLFASSFFMVGLQAIFFSLFSKLIASQQMNIPITGALELFLKKFTLDKGILIGLTLIFFAIIAAALSLKIWIHTELGILDPTKMMRITIPAVTSLISGTEIIFSSFFIHLLLLNSKSK